jgi:hypothetical protein
VLIGKGFDDGMSSDSTGFGYSSLTLALVNAVPAKS